MPRSAEPIPVVEDAADERRHSSRGACLENVPGDPQRIAFYHETP